MQKLLHCEVNDGNNTSPKKSADADKAGAQFSFGIPNLTPTSKPLSPSVAEVETTPKQQFSETYSTNTPALTPKEMEESSKASNENRDQFVFGSPQKHTFEFTPRSPRHHSSGCQGDEESDSFVEDEGDHIYFKPVIPLPEKIDVKTGEEQEEVLYCHRAKLIRFVQGEWKERGIGDIKILLKSDSGKLRVLMRCEQVLKICLNHILTADIEYLPKDDKTWRFSAPDYSECEINHWQFFLRFKTADIAQDFKTAVDQALQKTLVPGGSKIPPLTRGKLRLYSSRFCPYAQRVHLALDAKRIPYDVVNINLSNKPDWLYDKSPLGKIPALEVENGEVIYESLIIADYLDEKYPAHPLYPRDPLQKAKDRLLIDQFSKVISTMYKVILSTGRGHVDDHENVIMDGLVTFEKELASRGGPFFGGSKPGMLDYMIWPWCERADLLKLFGKQFVLKKGLYRKLMDWRTLMRDDFAVKKSYLSTESHIKYVQSYRAGVPEYDLIASS